ncbi:hypothetical protein ES703_28413 [subsurface metagenome]
MAIMAILVGVGTVVGLANIITPVPRWASQHMNRWWPNEILDPGSAIAVKRRGLSDTFDMNRELESQGFDDERQQLLYDLGKQLLGLSELITLYRRGGFESVDNLYAEAEKVGWSQPDVDYMLRVTEVIPSAGDIIRYAVREVYSPDIAEAFGQFDELPDVLSKAKKDITAAGMGEDTFSKEWAAHWLLPSIMQGFEMLHRGVIPFKSTGTQALSLERLMVALDIMPAWREPLKAISYSPYTRVDVRRMHKIGVLSDEEVFTAYADVGFSPFAPDCSHESVTAAFACEACRRNSKVGRMTDFTILYNAEPPEDETTDRDKEKIKNRDLTKTDILAGLRDGLLVEGEAKASLGLLGYDAIEIEYYIARIEFEREKDELSDTLRYLHDAYIKGVIDFSKVTDELGKLNLPAKMTDYYRKVWDLERVARTNKPTKSELMAFLRKGVIDTPTWRVEMSGLGYPERYIDWYARTV